MSKIRVAIVGVGNCASSLVQGIQYYSNPANPRIGLMHWDLGGFLPSDIEFAAAFDIDERKVGRDLAEAIFAPPNCTRVFCAEVPALGVAVRMGAILDGVADHMDTVSPARGFVRAKAAQPTQAEVVQALVESRAEVLVNFLPVGSEDATRFYMECALEAGVGVVNCMPVFIASDEAWERRFAERNIPIIGDDIKAQLGATIVHRTLSNLFRDRGVQIERTYQLNTGGNTDFLNMLDRGRLSSKKISKTEAVQSIFAERLDDDNIHVGPSDYVPWLNDNKLCFLRIEGSLFGGVAMEIEVRLSVEDSPNSAGVVIDAIRCCKLAQGRGLGGMLEGPSSYFCKHPPIQHADDDAHALTEDFIRRNGPPAPPTTCLIIAAGEGTRLRPVAPSKPLAPIVGVPMIERVIEIAARGGVEDFVVATGYEAERVEAFLDELSSDHALGMTYARNDQWRSLNGLSILAAEAHLGHRSILLMCDHLFDPSILEDLVRQPLAPDEVLLAVDRRMDNPLVRLDDVTRVELADDGRIKAIGKTLEIYNAFDTGIFLISPALFGAIREDVEAGGGSLSGAIQRLADRGLARTFDIGDRFWIDVDDAIAFEQAEQEERSARRRRHRRPAVL